MLTVLRDLEPVLTEYVYDLRARNVVEGTITNYKRSLHLWCDWIGKQKNGPKKLADVRKEHISRFLAERVELEAPDTVLTRHRHLRAFFKWCEAEEIVDRNPMATLREPIAPEQPPPVLNDDQLRAIFATTKADKTFAGIRDYALMLVLADTGMRVGELVGTKVDDINFDDSTIEVLGKGRRRRRVAFSARTGKALLAYLRARGQQNGAQNTDRLWTGTRGNLTVQTAWKIVRARGEAAGVEGVFPHQFRHTFGHRFRLHGGQDSDLQALGGWRDPKMLRRYGASAATERAIEAHRRVDHLGDVL
jgi:site-specific recombinase XerD